MSFMCINLHKVKFKLNLVGWFCWSENLIDNGHCMVLFFYYLWTVSICYEIITWNSMPLICVKLWKLHTCISIRRVSMKYLQRKSTCQIHMSIFQVITYLINCSIICVKSSVIDLYDWVASIRHISTCSIFNKLFTWSSKSRFDKST